MRDIVDLYQIQNQPQPLRRDYDPVNRQCQPMMNLSESSPKNTASPPERRFPNSFEYEPMKDGPSTRVESPRQQGFAFRNIDSNLQRGQKAQMARPFFPENETNSRNPPGVFSQGPWNTSFSSNEPIGLNPAISGNINVNGFDTEMSDQTNNSSNSTGLTPQSSASYNHSSSNTSYTPPGEESSTSTTQAASRPPIAGTYAPYTSVVTPHAESMFTAQGSASVNARSPVNDNVTGNEQEDPFKLPTSWDIGGGATPGVLSGMTPDGGWEKMMESWDRTG